ncbi:MAG: DUF262 domain-containing protein [Caldilineaceae bacterium]|nr:DUF262 domain-containing protein [Caldilineaceae bacterium]
MTESKAQIAFQQIGVAGVLKQYRLVVPPNQREFSWTANEVTTLLQDFSKAISDGDSEYFLGTLVTIPRSPALLEVVDGQQRLATTAILLAAIRNYLRETEKLISESIDNGFLTDIDRKRRERISKLQLNLDDNEFFRYRIASDTHSDVTPSRSSHKLIDDAFNQCSKHVKRIVAGFDRRDHGDVLDKWIEFVEHGAQVILLKVPSDVNAYKMFETLNDRGLKTSQADLIKNYLFGQSRERLSEAQQKWARMRGSLESLEENDITVTFLRYALITLRGYLREKQVYDAVQEKVKGPQDAIEFLTELEMLAASYVTIFNPEHERWNKYPDSTRRAIQTLNLLNIRPLRPLMLAVAHQFESISAAEAFRIFISWGVRLMIASSTRSGSVERPLADAAHLIQTGVIRKPDALKRKLSGTIPTDEQFRQGFESARVSKALLARYYLRSLEMAAKREPTPWFIPNDDRQTINLEHVLPQRPQDNWPMFDDEAVKLYAKRIGNLALLLAKSNSDLKSASFAEKREVYKKSPYKLTSQIADVPSWTETTIVERQKDLADLALRAWPL